MSRLDNGCGFFLMRGQWLASDVTMFCWDSDVVWMASLAWIIGEWLFVDDLYNNCKCGNIFRA